MFEPFLDRISQWNVIVGLIVVVLGFALMLSSKAIAGKVWKDKPEESQQRLTLILKCISGVLAVVGVVLVMFIGM